MKIINGGLFSKIQPKILNTVLRNVIRILAVTNEVEQQLRKLLDLN